MTSTIRLAAVFCLATAAAAHAAQPRYSLQTVGENWTGVGFNSANQFAGNDIAHDHGLVQEGGQTHRLVAQRGRSVAAGINLYGAVAGHDVDAAGVSRATLWRHYDKPKDLGVLPGGTFSFAAGINDAGQVVGTSGYGAEGNRTFAFIWKNGQMNSLGSLPGSDDSGASAINAKGQVVGWATTPVTRNRHAVRWTDGKIEDLGVLPGGQSSHATAVNRRGDVVGGAANPVGWLRPFMIRAGIDPVMKDLGTLFGAENEVCLATGINKAREVVGWCKDFDALRLGAFIYRGGRLQAINKFLDASAAGWYVYAASAIDDQGRILGEAEDPQGNWHPVLLTPLTAGQ